MTFAEAMDTMRAGGRVGRKSWVDKGVYVFIVKGSDISPVIEDKYSDKTSIREVHDVIVMNTSAGHICMSYTVKQGDIFATDWQVIA